MAKLAPARWSLARALIAGVLAWLLALQGLAAASPHGHFAPPAADRSLSQSSQDCGAPRGDDPAAPCQHEQCECCILCALGHDGVWLAALAASSSNFVAFPPPRLEIAFAWHFPGGERKPPSGWTSSWSQRAPPRLS